MNVLSCGHRIACSHHRIAFSKGNVETSDLPPQLEFDDHNVSDLNTQLPVGYTHTEFIRRLVIRGKIDADVPNRILVSVPEGQKLYQPAVRRVKL